MESWAYQYSFACRHSGVYYSSSPPPRLNDRLKYRHIGSEVVHPPQSKGSAGIAADIANLDRFFTMRLGRISIWWEIS
jgi:hypothetical protein